MENLDGAALRENLEPYLNRMQFDGLLARRDQIVEFFQEKVRRKGELSVLYNYLPRPARVEFTVSYPGGETLSDVRGRGQKSRTLLRMTDTMCGAGK